MELRAKTMSYSKKKRAEVKKREIVLQHNLDELDYKICNDADLNPLILDQYEAEKNKEAICTKKSCDVVFMKMKVI